MWNQIEREDIQRGIKEGWIRKAYKGIDIYSYDTWWSIQWSNGIPEPLTQQYHPQFWHESYKKLGWSREKFFIEFCLKEKPYWLELEKALNKGVAKIEYIRKNTLLQLQDRYGRWWGIISNNIKHVKDFMNYSPQMYKPIYHKLYGLTREQFFIDYALKLRSDWKDIEYGLQNGFVRIVPENTSMTFELRDRYNRWWHIGQKESSMENYYDFKGDHTPKAYRKGYGLTREQFFIDYTLKFRDDWQDVKESIKKGIIHRIEFDKGNHAILHIKTYEYPNLSIYYQNHKYSSFKPKELQMLSPAGEFQPLTVEEILERIDQLAEEATRERFLEIKRNIVSLKNCDDVAVQKLYDLAHELGINTTRNKGDFIEDYKKSVEIIKNATEDDIHIFDEPIILTLDNYQKLIKDKSIVWDLFKVSTKEVIYVGEHQHGQIEEKLVKLYIENDKLGTKQRRVDDGMCKTLEQPKIEDIFQYSPFIIRLIAVGQDKEPKFVRAYESVWNTECNDGRGALVKQ